MESPVLRHSDGVDDPLVGAVLVVWSLGSARFGATPISAQGSLVPSTLGQNAGMDLGRSLVAAVLLIIFMHGCDDGDGSDGATSRPSSSRSTSGPATGPTDPAVDGSLDRRVDEAREILARDEGLDIDEVTLVRAEPVEWRDSSYGCPSSEATYSPGPFPGYRIVLRADEHDYIFMGADDTEPRRCLFLD